MMQDQIDTAVKEKGDVDLDDLIAGSTTWEIK